MAHLHLVQSRLIASSPDPDTVECLEAMLQRAKRGEIIGIAYAAFKSDRQFCYGTCGEAHRNPVLAAGITQAMLYGITASMHGQEEGIQRD